MEPLSADLIPYISAPDASVLLVRVVSAKWTPLPAEDKEVGVIAMLVEEVFHGAAPKRGETIEVTGKRYADKHSRFRTPHDKWNTIPLEPGTHLLIAVRPAWDAIAAEAVEGPNDPALAAMRRACEIEAMKPEARRPAIEQALRSSAKILRDYALDLLGRRNGAGRDGGAEILARALFASDLPPANRLPIVKLLNDRAFYQFEHGADAVNVKVVRSTAALLTNGDADRKPLWTQFLAAALTIEFSKDAAKDAAMRNGLIQAVKDPSPQRVIAALEDQIAHGNRDPRTAKLLAEWRAAVQ